jgi:hypothetical protein
MKQKISETDWVNLITGACDIHGAVSDFTSIMCRFINNVNKTIDENNISNILM